MNDEEFEIMPHKTIENIKKELDELKQKANSKEYLSSENFKRSMDNLSVSINRLMSLFKTAAEEIKEEDKNEQDINAKIDPLLKKVEQIERENKTIAESILAVAEMLKEKKIEPEREIIRRTWKENVAPKQQQMHQPRRQHIAPQIRPPESANMQSSFSQMQSFPSSSMDDQPRLIPARQMGMQKDFSFQRQTPPGAMPPPGPMPPPEFMPGAPRKKGFFDKLMNK